MTLCQAITHSIVNFAVPSLPSANIYFILQCLKDVALILRKATSHLTRRPGLTLSLRQLPSSRLLSNVLSQRCPGCHITCIIIPWIWRSYILHMEESILHGALFGDNFFIINSYYSFKDFPLNNRHALPSVGVFLWHPLGLNELDQDFSTQISYVHHIKSTF